MTILQLGTGTETVAAMENGRVAMAALTIRYAIPLFSARLADVGGFEHHRLGLSLVLCRQQPSFRQSRAQSWWKIFCAPMSPESSDQEGSEFRREVVLQVATRKGVVFVRKAVEAYSDIQTGALRAGQRDRNRDQGFGEPATGAKGISNRPELFRDNGPSEESFTIMKLVRFFCCCCFMRYYGAPPSPRPGTSPSPYGTSASVAHLPVWVGKDAGFFAKKGLNVEPMQIAAARLITMGIMSGAVLSGAGAESVVAARIEGGDIVLLACPSNLEPVYLITRPEIKSAADLKGKSSAVTRWIVDAFLLARRLENGGLGFRERHHAFATGSSPEMATALETGKIAAAALTIRDAIPFMRRGWPVLVDLARPIWFIRPPASPAAAPSSKPNPKPSMDFSTPT